MSYQEVKKYQQNFFTEAGGSGTYQKFNFKPLMKGKPNNKWKLTCVNIAFYNNEVDDLIPHCIWMRNCPLLTGFGNATDGTTSTNDILLGTMSAMVKTTGATEMSESAVLRTSFIVNEINQDPFELMWTHLTDPFNLDGVETASFMTSFEITELELV